MKFARCFASCAVVALMLSLSAFAKDSHSGKFTISEPVQVGSTQLAPGDYKVEWSGSTNNIHIEILQSGKTVVTTQGTIQTLPKPSPYNAIGTKTLSDGTEKLTEIEFENHLDALMVGGE